MTTPKDNKKSAPIRTGLAGAAIGTGALVGGLMVLPGIASAQDETVPDETVPDETVPDTTAPDISATERPNVLEDLVEEGVITQDQADTIQERFAAARAEFGGHRGHRGHRGFGARAASGVVTDMLGLSAEEVYEAFQSGQSLADLAEAQGVSVDDLVDALVAEATETVNEKLAAGDITADRAESILDGLEENVEDRVNAERPVHEGDRGGRRGHRGGGIGTDSGDDVDASLPSA